MKASRFLGNKTFAVTDLPTPHAGPGELVLRNQVCGVCGTDVHIYHGEPGSADVNPPVVLGHEYSGEVVEVGKGVTGFAVGDHVTVDPNIYCGHCAYCQNGKKQLCPSMEAIGVTRDGGFAQYSLIPASQAFKLEPTVPWEAAAMAEPLACCLHGIDLAGIQVGDKVWRRHRFADGAAGQTVRRVPNRPQRAQREATPGGPPAGRQCCPRPHPARCPGGLCPGSGRRRQRGHRVCGQCPRRKERLPVRRQGGHGAAVQCCSACPRWTPPSICPSLTCTRRS